MVRFSNGLVGVFNILLFLVSIPIIIMGAAMNHNSTFDCERLMHRPIIILAVALLVIALAGVFGACCRVIWLLWIYLACIFFLILFMLCFTIWALIIMHEGAGKLVSNRGFKEYTLGDYSNWLQKTMSKDENWKVVKNCLIAGEVCQNFAIYNGNLTLQNFNKKDLNPVQSGCCKPSEECKFTFVSQIEWTKPANPTTYSNGECNAWSNDNKTMCYDCESCKAGILQYAKGSWKVVVLVNFGIMILLIVVYSCGCCAFRNNRRDKAHGGYKGYP